MTNHEIVKDVLKEFANKWRYAFGNCWGTYNDAVNSSIDATIEAMLEEKQGEETGEQQITKEADLLRDFLYKISFALINDDRFDICEYRDIMAVIRQTLETFLEEHK